MKLGQWLLANSYSTVRPFFTHLGLYEFLKLTFGMKMASKIFQQSLNTMFAGYLHKWLVVYVDDNTVDTDRRRSPCKLFVVVSETG